MVKFLCVQAQSLSLYYSMNCAFLLHVFRIVPQVKVASDGGGDLGGGSSIPKCPSAPDIAHHKLDVSSTGGGGSARQQHLSGGGGGDSRNGDLLEYDLISPPSSDDNVMQIWTKLCDWAYRPIIACYFRAVFPSFERLQGKCSEDCTKRVNCSHFTLSVQSWKHLHHNLSNDEKNRLVLSGSIVLV